MNGLRKPRRVRFPAICNTLEMAKSMVAMPQKRDVDDVMRIMTAAGKAMREGVATEMHWSILAGGVSMGQAIERQRVVRGMAGHLVSTEQALNTIFKRAHSTGAWKSLTLYFDEIDMITAFINLHSFQVRQLSRGEYRAAIASAGGEIRSSGCTVNLERDFAGVAV
jgi:hypothetical protein